MENISELYPRVVEIVADVLVIEPSDITPDSSLIKDLGAESIDFLDLIFRLERAFNIKIPRGQIEKEARGKLSEEEFEKGGVISEKGLVVLKDYLSEVPADRFKNSMKVSEIPALFTVTTLCKLVKNAQAKSQDQAASATTNPSV